MQVGGWVDALLEKSDGNARGSGRYFIEEFARSVCICGCHIPRTHAVAKGARSGAAPAFPRLSLVGDCLPVRATDQCWVAAGEPEPATRAAAMSPATSDAAAAPTSKEVWLRGQLDSATVQLAVEVSARRAAGARAVVLEGAAAAAGRDKANTTRRLQYMRDLLRSERASRTEADLRRNSAEALACSFRGQLADLEQEYVPPQPISCMCSRPPTVYR